MNALNLPSLQNFRVDDWVAVNGDSTLRLDYDLGPDSVVVDLGAYRGDFAREMVARFGCRLFLSEPVPSFVEDLRSLFLQNPKVRILPFAVGAEEGVLSLSLDGDATSSFKEGASQVTAPVRPIPAVLDELGVREVDLLKINVEGAEYEILHALIDSGWMERIRNLQVQFHDFVPDADRKLADIRQRLLPTHYATYMHTFVWENWRLRTGDPHEQTLHALVLGMAGLRERSALQARELASQRALLEHMLHSSWRERSARLIRRALPGSRVTGNSQT